jgi:phage terminase small subunit
MAKAVGNTLTEKQRLFVYHYLANGFNAVDAARSAGYKGDYRTLGVTGHDNLKNPKIRALIDERLNDVAMSADEALARLGKIARGDMSAFLDDDNALDLSKARELGVLHLVKELDETEIYDKEGDVMRVKRKAKLYDAHSALVDILKMHGRYVDRKDITSGGEPLLGFETVMPDDPDV